MTKSRQPGLQFPTTLTALPPSLPRHEPNWASGRGAGRVPARCRRRRPPQCLSRLSTAPVVGAASSTQFSEETPVRDQRTYDATHRHPPSDPARATPPRPGPPSPCSVPEPPGPERPVGPLPHSSLGTPTAAAPHPEHGLRLLRRRLPPRGEYELRLAAPSPAFAALRTERDPGKRSRARPPSPTFARRPQLGPAPLRPAGPLGRRAHPPPRGHGPSPPWLGLAGSPPHFPGAGPAPSERLRARCCRPLHRPGRAPPPRRPRPGGPYSGAGLPRPPLPLLPGSGPRAAPPGRGRGAGCAAGAGRSPRGPPCLSCGREAPGPARPRDTHPGPTGVPHPTGGPRTFRGLRGRAGGARHLLREGGRVPGRRCGAAPHSCPRPRSPSPPPRYSLGRN